VKYHQDKHKHKHKHDWASEHDKHCFSAWVAHATLARVTHIASDLESAKVKASSLFDVGTLNMPQNPDGLRILDEDGHEVFFWTQGTNDS
jgi:hypothetical protein